MNKLTDQEKAFRKKVSNYIEDLWIEVESEFKPDSSKQLLWSPMGLYKVKHNGKTITCDVRINKVVKLYCNIKV